MVEGISSKVFNETSNFVTCQRASWCFGWVVASWKRSLEDGRLGWITMALGFGRKNETTTKNKLSISNEWKELMKVEKYDFGYTYLSNKILEKDNPETVTWKLQSHGLFRWVKKLPSLDKGTVDWSTGGFTMFHTDGSDVKSLEIIT